MRPDRPFLGSRKHKDLQDPLPRKIEGKVLRSGREIMDTMIDLIGQAKYSVDMQFYAFEAKDRGKEIIEACVKAHEANPNLKIRVLIDNSVEYLHNGKIVGRDEEAKKDRDETNELLMRYRDEGVLEEVAVTNWFNPGNQTANVLRLYSNILHRDHKKLFLVDSRDREMYPDAKPKAIVGSANITNNHSDFWKDGGRLFSDEGLVKVLQEDFEYTASHAKKWKRVYDAPSPSKYWEKYGHDLLRRGALLDLAKDGWASIVRNAERRGRRIVVTPDPEGRKERDQVFATDSAYPRWFFGLGRHAATEENFKLLKKAKPGEIVNIPTPYPGFYVLTHHMLKASKRGVKVNLIIPKKNNHVLYNHEKIDALSLPKLLGPIDPVLRRAAHANLTHWERRLSNGGIDIFKYTGKKEGLDAMLHFKGATLERNDGSVRSINGSPNLSKGLMSGFNRELIVATEGEAETDGLLAFIEELKDDSEHIEPPKPKRRK